MGVPHMDVPRPSGHWHAVRPYRAKKKTQFIFWMALLAIVLFFLIGDVMLLLASGDRFIDEEEYACCYSIGIGLAIVLAFIAFRHYRHHLILSIMDDPVYRTFMVSSPHEMVDVVDNALDALEMEHTRMDPPGRAFTNIRRFPRNLAGMFRVHDPPICYSRAGGNPGLIMREAR